MKTIEGKLDASKLSVAIVVARFNELVANGLVSGALDCLRRHGAKDEKIDLIRVPGAFEIPLVAKKIAKSYDAVICLGAVIRGGTAHFDYVASEVAKGVAQAALETGTPIIFGVLTTDTLEQALERAGAKSGNKGFNAAMSAIELANLTKQL
ncbi:6,7-dimethyl-8-ribityllumazine synthase [Candidatus Saganbacteria bacterium CG08_land_8_20_14_0_20_45_16]|uniref:6,7-dimethyl-8-ribityllumazine synthase n=1 Tax=Candidatus Saganbacteria bacterium CG08_land_8_20_14_0_20_45_16 TaxID=2014293 RepID=A0A2H0XWS1_UNCSA|nr:MAG: 6,7-dimethyl-8-ribityllumazine synthase [Candidatus Saganbacteria bacterium CG08_land_8_20_14_0_20_45_16]